MIKDRSIIFSIVGIANYLSDEEINRITDSKETLNVIIKPEPTNFFDPNAIVVLLDGEIIGYVRKADISEKCILEILNKSSRKTHCATIIGKSDGFMSFEAYMEYQGEKIEPTDRDTLFHNWKYSFVKLQMPKEINELIDVMDSMITLLEKSIANKSNFQKLFEKYKDLVSYGFSKEFFYDRLKLYNMLKNHESHEMRAFAEELIQISKMIHENKTHLNAYSHIMKSMKNNIANEYSDIVREYSIKSVQKELAAFPHNLYDCRKRIDDFPTRLFYEQIPRDVLFKFLSGMAICGFLGEGKKTKKKKTNNKRGRKRKDTNDTNPLLKQMVKPLSYYEKVKEFISDLLGEKKGYKAGLVMCAIVKCNILYAAPWKDVKKTFGDIGNENDYNEGMQYTKKDSKGYKKPGQEGYFELFCQYANIFNDSLMKTSLLDQNNTEIRQKLDQK